MEQEQYFTSSRRRFSAWLCIPTPPTRPEALGLTGRARFIILGARNGGGIVTGLKPKPKLSSRRDTRSLAQSYRHDLHAHAFLRRVGELHCGRPSLHTGGRYLHKHAQTALSYMSSQVIAVLLYLQPSIINHSSQGCKVPFLKHQIYARPYPAIQQTAYGIFHLYQTTLAHDRCRTDPDSSPHSKPLPNRSQGQQEWKAGNDANPEGNISRPRSVFIAEEWKKGQNGFIT